VACLVHSDVNSDETLKCQRTKIIDEKSKENVFNSNNALTAFCETHFEYFNEQNAKIHLD